MIAFRLVAIVLMAALLGGCVTRPTARVEIAEVAGTTEEAVVLTCTIIASNAGETELPLRMVDYTLVIEGRRVFRGRRSAEATLSRQAEHSIELPVPVLWADLPEGEVEFRLEGQLGYTLPGIFLEAMYDARLYRPTVGFEYEGTLDGTALRGG
ncbi:MAG: hypothetical protein HRU13_01320 [Phycisphaerales bacterium]|nr:hypothetical protein [Phycisphaerales bacterium]